MEKMCFRFVDSKLFSRRNSLRLYGETALPELPTARQYDPTSGEKPHPSYVMSRDEERQRFMEYNFAKRMMNRLITAAEFRKAKKWERRQDHLCEYLTRINMPLVYSQVARNLHRWPYIDYADCISEGGLALMRSINGNQTERETKFSTYAVRTILNSLTAINRRAGLRKSRVATVELPELLGQGEIDLEASGDGDREDLEILADVVKRNLAELKDQELTVIKHRFGLEGVPAVTLEVVGDILGVTKERVRQIQIKALSKLREHMVET